MAEPTRLIHEIADAMGKMTALLRELVEVEEGTVLEPAVSGGSVGKTRSGKEGGGVIGVDQGSGSREQKWLKAVARAVSGANISGAQEFDLEMVKRAAPPIDFPQDDEIKNLEAYILGQVFHRISKLRERTFSSSVVVVTKWLKSFSQMSQKLERYETLPDPAFIADMMLRVFIAGTEDSFDWDRGTGSAGTSKLKSGMLEMSIHAEMQVDRNPDYWLMEKKVGQPYTFSFKDSAFFGEWSPVRLRKAIIDDVENPAGVKSALSSIYGKATKLVDLPLSMKLTVDMVFSWAVGPKNTFGGLSDSPCDPAIVVFERAPQKPWAIVAGPNTLVVQRFNEQIGKVSAYIDGTLLSSFTLDDLAGNDS